VVKGLNAEYFEWLAGHAKATADHITKNPEARGFYRGQARAFEDVAWMLKAQETQVADTVSPGIL
jgi:hypothetical protein